MARVDFYVLARPGELARNNFACRLAEKAYRLDNTVHINVASQDDARRIDDLLWTFRDGSFVPHHLLGTERDGLPSPVTIACGERPTEARDLLINLGADVPSFAEAFPRVAELVTSDEESKQQSRRRFVQYRNQGYTLETHNV